MYKRKKKIHGLLLRVFLILKYGLIAGGILLMLLLKLDWVLNYLILFLSLFLSILSHKFANRQSDLLLKYRICIYLDEVEKDQLSEKQIKEHVLFDRVKDILKK